MEDLVVKAKEILKEVPYLTIASITPEGLPHNTPVFTVHDENYNFFWNSEVTSQHSKNIRNSPQVFCVIYNSSVAQGKGKGVYILGKAYELNDSEELKEALEVFYGGIGKEPKPFDFFLGENTKRFYKFVPERFWLNELNKKDGIIVDGKTEIIL
jgi:general stress protein 26